jgi:hypothetical protein
VRLFSKWYIAALAVADAFGLALLALAALRPDTVVPASVYQGVLGLCIGTFILANFVVFRDQETEITKLKNCD